MLSPQHPRVLLALAEPLQLCKPFPWELELPGLSHLPRFTLCPPSPQGSEFVLMWLLGRGWSQGSAPLCPPEKGAAWRRQSLVGIMSPVTDAHADFPPLALTGGRQAALVGVSCVPLPLTL